MTDHPDFGALNDLVDGRLTPERTAEVRAHLAACGHCQAAYGALGAVIDRAAALPRDVAPPPELWNEVRGRLATRPHVASRRFTPNALAAAALLAAALGSGVTGLVMRQGHQGTEQVASVPPPPALPAQLTSIEIRYAESAARLEATLAERRDSLAPATVATVERSLRIADSAIAEARAALERDPANRAIEAILASNYERKIDLLRRANALSPRT
jgi:anti-sigma factor RsiW